MSQASLLFLGLALGLSTPLISETFEVSSVSAILSCLFLLLFIQESWFIQWKMRQENVEFTRRFNRKFPPGEFSAVRYGPHFVGFFGVLLFMIFIDLRTDLIAIHAYICLFFILKLVSDPLLGCLAEQSKRFFQPVFAYVVIYIYATTSSFDSAIFALTPIPWPQSVSFAMFFLAVLQMRMAYYQKFCFKSDISVEGQLNFVLFSLLLLSFPRLAYAMDILGSGLR